MTPLTNFICAGRAYSARDSVRAGRIRQAVWRRHGRHHHQDDEPRHTNILVWGAIAVELGVGLCLMAGLFARWAALILAAYTVALHAYWQAPAAEARFERIIFFNHISIIGGMLAIVAFGAGCWSLDAAMRRRSA